jgi:hypothetical protein
MSIIAPGVRLGNARVIPEAWDSGVNVRRAGCQNELLTSRKLSLSINVFSDSVPRVPIQ